MVQKPARRFASHKNPPKIFKHAAELRQAGSIVERTLWRALREQLKGTDIRMRYQYPCHPYIADFACVSAQLIIEVDGMSHDSTYEYDMKRTAHFEREGFEVIRFSNADVMKDAEGIATMIIEYALKRRAEIWRRASA